MSCPSKRVCELCEEDPIAGSIQDAFETHRVPLDEGLNTIELNLAGPRYGNRNSEAFEVSPSDELVQAVANCIDCT
jgi:hypothetical protein